MNGAKDCGNSLCFSVTVRSASELIEAGKEHQPDVIVFNERLDQLIDVLVIVERLKQVCRHRTVTSLASTKEGCPYNFAQRVMCQCHNLQE